jgi:hypothetical protein
VNWLRTRQEESELGFWLSLVSYDRKDQSLTNRAYLIYLIIFFGVWIFLMLTLLASGGSMILQAIQPGNPELAACGLLVVILAGWWFFGMNLASRRSPVVFNETDALLIGQSPVSRRRIVLRWFWMPWLKNALPFWMLTLVLGFSLAEISINGPISAERLPEYTIYGLRPLMAILPLQLALFSLQWGTGVLRLQKDREIRRFAWPVSAAVLAVGVWLSFAAFSAPAGLATWLLHPLLQGFSGGMSTASALTLWAFALLAWLLLAILSGNFNLSRAMQETREVELTNNAIRYGMTDYLKLRRAKKKLGVGHESTRLPIPAGGKALIWKDLVESRRTLSMGTVFNWIIVFAIMLSLPLLPDLASRSIVLVFWVIWVGRITNQRLRSDLAGWPLLRQLPVAGDRVILYGMISSLLGVTVLSLLGLTAGVFLFQTRLLLFLGLIPGLVAQTALTAAFDVIRHARSNRLLDGSVPQISAGGILLGVALAALVWLGANLSSSLFSLFLIFALNWLIVWGLYRLVGGFYTRIDAA